MMIKNSLSPYIIAALMLSISACKSSFDEPKYTSGNADFTRYVALGNSLTAGYQDNALCYDGQKDAYPSILHKQFTNVGGDEIFNIPYLTGNDAILGVTPNPVPGHDLATNPKLILGYSIDNCTGISTLGPKLIGPGDLNNTNFYLTVIGAGHVYHNLGVPGARVFNLTEQTFGNIFFGGNPYYQRFASDPGTSTIVDDAKASNPTFFTLWIGNNDVLGYATSGGNGEATGATYPFNNSITPLDTFTNSFNRIVDELLATGAQGAIGNIPDVTDIPFFTTVPYNGFNLTDINQVNALNTSYINYNATAKLLGKDTIAFKLGNNAYIIQDFSAAYQQLDSLRQIKPNELIILSIPQDSIKCGAWGSLNGIPPQYVLDATEIQNCKTATKNFNNVIKSKVTANDNKLLYVDFNSYFKTVVSGIKFNGVAFTPEYVRGGAFSLDGVHPNTRGYALIANFWIQNINAKFDSNIPQVDVNSYPGITFP